MGEFVTPRSQGAKRAEPSAEINAVARQIVDAAFHIHQDIGPGLLESAYETLLAVKLSRMGFDVERQVLVDAVHEGIELQGAFRLDILVNQAIVLEIKSVEKSMPIHGKQLMTYLKLGRYPLGFVLNFGTILFRDGIRRLVNSDALLAPSPLGVAKSTAQTAGEHDVS